MPLLMEPVQEALLKLRPHDARTVVRIAVDPHYRFSLGLLDDLLHLALPLVFFPPFLLLAFYVLFRQTFKI